MREFEIDPKSEEDLEQLGTKEKFWLINDEDESQWLFKYSRENTGEHWAEKIAEQLCNLLEIPHVKHELAICKGRRGVITKNIVPKNCTLIMGNEILHAHDPNHYPAPNTNERIVRVKAHTISSVKQCLQDLNVLAPIDFKKTNLSASDVFCGYLLLDVLISNQDRHHENWGVIVHNQTQVFTLCPSYDHASSLGRELLDQERFERLHTKDKNRQIKAFVAKSKSELFSSSTDSKPLKTIDAFFKSVEDSGNAKKYWSSQLKKVSSSDFEDIVNKVFDDVMTAISKEFTIKMLLENQKRLLEDERA